jgi:hypothetical protein
VVVRGEEPELVLDDPATQAEPDVGPVVAVQAHPLKVVVGSDLLIGAEAEGVVVDEGVAMKLVTTRLRDDVDHAAERPSVFRLIPAGLDLDFLDELPVDRLPLEAADDIRRIDTIDDELVLDGRRAVHRQRQGASLRVALVLVDPRVRADDLGIVSAEWKVLHDFCAVVRAAGRRGRVDHRNLARDDDGFLGGQRDLQVHVAVASRATVALFSTVPRPVRVPVTL